MSTPLDDALLDAALTPHLERIAGYLRGAGLAQVSPDHGVLRQCLATFMNAATPAIIDRWLGEIGPALGIPRLLPRPVPTQPRAPLQTPTSP